MKYLSVFLLTSLLLISFTNIYADQEENRKAAIQKQAAQYRLLKTYFLKNLLKGLQDIENEHDLSAKARKVEQFNLIVKEVNETTLDWERRIDTGLANTRLHPEPQQFMENMREDLHGLRLLINEIGNGTNGGAHEKIRNQLNKAP